MSKSAVALIFVGLFLFGGVISFWKQKLPKSVMLVLGMGAGMCLAAGVMRL
ncbi:MULTISPECIES: hypothetical protein [Kitasatospora]|uniref:Amidotransferase n=1 Tax=Kitasatospora cathayae TaxID=3004092 RepID=A0ABY7QAT1_9ACTN|nr:hypothetical protein [Kitasatospora sp. HUAS 3-15]WBP89334.1 hypothetical protein O1G21_28140 [Kitasatospora sp. HUAS 3-15]